MRLWVKRQSNRLPYVIERRRLASRSLFYTDLFSYVVEICGLGMHHFCFIECAHCQTPHRLLSSCLDTRLLYFFLTPFTLVNAKTTLPQSATITAQGCVYSMFCKTVFTESGVDLCAGNVLSPQYDQTCPSAGLYRISTSFNLPSNSNAASLLSGKTVTVKATIASSDSSTTCSFQATASNGSAYQMSWGSMAAASLVFVALGAYGIRRRRRSMAQIDLDAAEDQLPSSDFELMKSSPLPHVTMA